MTSILQEKKKSLKELFKDVPGVDKNEFVIIVSFINLWTFLKILIFVVDFFKMFPTPTGQLFHVNMNIVLPVAFHFRLCLWFDVIMLAVHFQYWINLFLLPPTSPLSQLKEKYNKEGKKEKMKVRMRAAQKQD